MFDYEGVDPLFYYMILTGENSPNNLYETQVPGEGEVDLIEQRGIMQVLFRSLCDAYNASNLTVHFAVCTTYSVLANGTMPEIVRRYRGHSHISSKSQDFFWKAIAGNVDPNHVNSPENEKVKKIFNIAGTGIPLFGPPMRQILHNLRVYGATGGHIQVLIIVGRHPQPRGSNI